MKKKIIITILILFPFASAIASELPNKYYIENVPFSPQAPFAKWSDPRQQDACEEMSATLAVYWARGRSLTRTQSEKTILDIAKFETKKYKNYRDTSAADTAKRIIKEYFGYTKYEIKNDITIDDIKIALSENKIVIVPTNGQWLKNPNFKRPGPERHMLVIRGYNSVKKTFTTNDPGTRKGENYKYDEKILYNAIRDYPTGNHIAIKGVKKNMITVWK